MTNKTAHDVTDDDRRLARKWAEDIESATNSVDLTTNPWSDRARAAARVILHAVPTPPTLAPALPDGWRHADHKKHGRVIVTSGTTDEDGLVAFVRRDDDLHRGHGYDWCKPDKLTFLDKEADQ